MNDTLAQWRADAEAVIAEHRKRTYSTDCAVCQDTEPGLPDFSTPVPWPCAPVIQARRVLALVACVEAADEVVESRREDQLSWERKYIVTRAGLATEGVG